MTTKVSPLSKTDLTLQPFLSGAQKKRSFVRFGSSLSLSFEAKYQKLGGWVREIERVRYS
jgi:hypothetical protein